MGPGLEQLPWRGPGPGRPELPLPPGPMPVLGAGRRLRKRWRYVAAFADEFLICAARVQVGPVGQTFWAVVDREKGEMLERTRIRPPFGRGQVWSEFEGGRPWPIGSDEAGAITRLEAGDVKAKLRIGEGRWAESICPNGEGGYVWTRKRVAKIDCDVRLPGGRRFQVEARGIEDESAGYHPRHTVWSWSAGVGTSADGRAVGWNLVSGVNDPERNSERAIWLDGELLEPDPVDFDDELTGIDFADGSRLEFEAEAERQAAQNLGLVRYSYRQPFGSFSGSLAGIQLESGAGVMEFHDAVW
ncbi:MAG: DUF2804 family protein [Solirubrobacterales bacterium]|nr:MAG: DUF2804 family protein [Solirubrobacterales bacterium]